MLALFYGDKKPSDVESFLEPFLEEFKSLDGVLNYNGKAYTLRLGSFVCDAPARAFMKRIIGHTGYHSCERCCSKGERIDSRTVLSDEVDTELRNGVVFDELGYTGTHQTGQSPLIGVIDCVTGFVLDYMHLVCLGVMRRMVTYWKKGVGTPARLSPSLLRVLSERLDLLRGKLPSDIARQPRAISHSDRWKATEFRTLMLYTGPVVLEGILSNQHYRHFCLLSLAMNILLEKNDEVRKYYLNYARELLALFVSQCHMLYGASFISYNIHSLLHLADDCVNHNCSLDDLSAFPYENMLGALKSLVRSPNNPVAQVVKRLKATAGSFRPGKLCHEKISANPRDSVFMLQCGQLVQIVAIEDNSKILCKVLQSHILKTLYNYPANSKDFGIVKVLKSKLASIAVEPFNISDIERKVICIELSSNAEYLAFLPLRHLYTSVRETNS